MSPEVSDLLKRALALPVDERAALANTLLDSLEEPQQSIQAAGRRSSAPHAGSEGAQIRNRPLGRTASRAVGDANPELGTRYWVLINQLINGIC